MDIWIISPEDVCVSWSFAATLDSVLESSTDAPEAVHDNACYDDNNNNNNNNSNNFITFNGCLFRVITSINIKKIYQIIIHSKYFPYSDWLKATV